MVRYVDETERRTERLKKESNEKILNPWKNREKQIEEIFKKGLISGNLKDYLKDLALLDCYLDSARLFTREGVMIIVGQAFGRAQECLGNIVFHLSGRNKNLYQIAEDRYNNRVIECNTILEAVA